MQTAFSMLYGYIFMHLETHTHALYILYTVHVCVFLNVYIFCNVLLFDFFPEKVLFC